MERIGTYTKSIPAITTDQMIEVDRLMIEKYHIELIQMMENAGRCLAILAMDRYLNDNAQNKQVVILAGTGGNGGGAMVCARRLHSWGIKVVVYTTKTATYMTPIPLHQLNILKQMAIPVYEANSPSSTTAADLIIDGIIGYSIKGDPYGTPKQMIEWANGHSASTISLDTPSGLDLTTAKVYNPTVKADATLTLALPKKGLYASSSKHVIGDLYLGDISVPTALYRADSLGVNVEDNLFAQHDVLALTSTNI